MSPKGIQSYEFDHQAKAPKKGNVFASRTNRIHVKAGHEGSIIAAIASRHAGTKAIVANRPAHKPAVLAP